MPPTATADPHLRELLVALNAELELPREVVYRLALDLLGSSGAAGSSLEAALRRLQLWPRLAARVRVAARRRYDLARREEEAADRCGGRIVTIAEPAYPSCLRELPLPPAVLYVQGEMPPARGLGVVGSRQADAYGLEVSEAFAGALASWGLPVVSGFARGIDATAHRAALAVDGGRTVAVLGCGLDIDYPRGHAGLRRQIASAGALITEFPIATAPKAQNFPVRNRIIAALSHGVLVVQATHSSGSLITARLALELGRDVYAVPGRIFDPRAAGPNTLIRDGALLAQHPREIVDSLPLEVRQQLAPVPGADGPTAPLPGLQGELLCLLATEGAQAPDQLAARAGQPLERVLGCLLELELASRVRREPGALYRVAR